VGQGKVNARVLISKVSTPGEERRDRKPANKRPETVFVNLALRKRSQSENLVPGRWKGEKKKI